MIDYTLEEFQTLYRADPFYAWFGLDSALLYTAHRAADGMTSIYRQIGIGCQRLIQQILMDQLGLTSDEATWSYQVKQRGGKPRRLALDARIELTAVASQERQDKISRWLKNARWLILTGTTNGPATASTYTFCREVLGYDLAGFFERNSDQLKVEIEEILRALLR